LPVPTSSDVFWLLLALVALLWPLDIAVRRLTMSSAQAAAAVRSLASLRRPAGIELEAPPELARLRQRVAGGRRGSATAPPPPVIGDSAPTPERVTGQTETETETAAALSARLLEARRRRRGSGD